MDIDDAKASKEESLSAFAHPGVLHAIIAQKNTPASSTMLDKALPQVMWLAELSCFLLCVR